MTILKSLFTFSAGLALLGYAGEGPEIIFSKDFHDFGVIEKGTKVTTTFEFQNTGKADLEISEVKVSCGCTSAALDKTVYKPGESGVVPVSFDSTRFSGTIHKTVTVKSNAANNPELQLELTGNVQAEVNIKPVNLTLFSIKRGEHFERQIEISTAKLDRLEISELRSNLEFLKLEPVRLDDRKINLKVSFSGKDLPKDNDNYRGMISFKTNAASQPRVSTAIYIRVASPIRVIPGSVNFFASPKGKSRETVVELSPTEAEAVKILKVESSLDFVKAEPIEGEAAKLKVTLSDKAGNGNFSGTITVETNLKDQPQVRIHVRGSIL